MNGLENQTRAAVRWPQDTDRPYCRVCGEVCDFIPIFVRYSEHTGESLYRLRMRCPNKRWFLDRHKSILVRAYLSSDVMALYTEKQLHEKGWWNDNTR